MSSVNGASARFRSIVVAVVSALLLSLTIAVAPAASATPPRSGPTTGLTVTSTGNTVLAGASGRVSVSASNTDSADQFNATTVVVLPVGVTYVAGSTQGPVGVGDPTILTWIPDPNSPNPQNPDTAQVLVWENTADLPQGSSTTLSFAIAADNTRYPVGSSFQVGMGVYANSDERVVPTVTVPPSGAPDVTTATTGGTQDSTVTVAALLITKAEIRNAEAEVYRGPANAAEFKVTVKTADAAGTNAVVVTDLVPATFTVTGCGAAYTCEIVTSGGKVFTKLVWNLGDLPAGQTRELTYQAYVAEREVTMPDSPTPGASTRSTGSGYAVTNTATAAGAYQGSVTGGGSTSITVDAKATVRVLDVGVVKTSADSGFHEGQTKRYTLAVRSSQFITSDGLTITDTIPDGMCPVLPAGVPQGGDPWPSDCASLATGTVTGATMQSAVHDSSTGRYTVTFTLPALAESASTSVSYDVYMRATLHDGTPTSVGGSFTNEVVVGGTTTPVPGSVDSGPASVTNDSAATLGTGAVTLTKTVWANPARSTITGPASCSGKTYTDTTGTAAPSFQLGDLVCFRLMADFPAGASTQSVRLADIFPSGMSLASTIVTSWAPASSNNVGIVSLGGGAASPRWQLGDPAGGGVFYVQPGGHLEMYVVARINTVEKAATKVAGNLAKLQYASAAGGVIALRDGADVQLAPPPPLTLDKKVNGADALTPVKEGQALTYTIDVKHNGTAAGRTDYPLAEVEVWDVLPAGFDCGSISAATPAFTSCALQPDGTTRVTWLVDRSASPLQPQETLAISYTLTVPTPLSISSTHINTAAVTRYRPISTNGMAGTPDLAVFYPTNPVGAYPNLTNAPQASDTATIGLDDAGAAKSVVSTSVTELNNSALGQATIGETVVWQYTATIPARTSIFNGVLSDGLPVGGRLTAGAAPTATSSTGASVGDGCTQDASEFRLCADAADAAYGSLFFPTTWTNETDELATFTVRMTTRVADVEANAHNTMIANTTTLTSTPTAAGGAAVVRATANAQVTVVVPAPTIQKAASITGNGAGIGSGTWVTADNTLTTVGGGTVYYRLTAGNGSTTPPLHDPVIVDCIDNRLGGLVNGTAPSVATVSGPEAGNGLNGCEFGRDKYTWTLASALAASTPIYYSVVVPEPIPASTPFTNTATLTGSTLEGAVAGERTLSVVDSLIVLAAPPVVTKTRTFPAAGGTLVPGESATWRVAVTIPAGVNLYEARILDTLGTPLGIPADATFAVSCAPDWTGDCPTAATRLPAPAGSPQVLGVYLDDIAAAREDRTLYLDVTTKVPTATAATVLTATNQARISWNVSDSTPPTTAVPGTNATGDVSATLDIRHPLVTVTKAVSTPGVRKAQGETFTYTVTTRAVQNVSPNGKPAYNVKIVDTVPAGVVPTESTISNGGVWDATARTITWTVATLTPGAAATTFTYDAKLALASSLNGTALQNSVRPASWDSLATGGKTYGPGTAATASVTPAFPKIDTTKSLLSTNPVYIGDEVSYSFTMTNSGTARAVSLSAVDTLPVGWTYVPGSARLGGAPLDNPDIVGQQLTWANLGPLNAGSALTITYRAVAGSSVAVGSGVAHTNTVVAAQVTDATGGTSYNAGRGSYVGTSGSATARIDQADLQITKTAGTFTAGGTGSFTMVVRNNGGDTAEGVALRDELTLPAGVTVTTVDAGTGGTCTITAGVLNCSLASLAATASWTVTLNLAIAADVASGTTVPNTATVSARTADRTPGNNTSSATGTVATSADLEVVKRVVTPATGAVVAGTPIEWSITLTNKGPSLSRGSAGSPIVLTDTLPSGISGPALTGTVPPGCTLTGQVVRCEVTHDMTVGESIVLTVSGTVRSDVPAGTAAIVNTATVTPVTTDPVTSNNTSTTRTDLAVRETLAIVKTITDPAPPAPVIPGNQITYRLQVSNGGPSVARGVYVIDTLPAHIAFGALVSGTGWSAASGPAGTVRFTYTGVLAAGADAPPIVYTATLDPAFTGAADELKNTASVSSAWKADQDSSSATPGTPNPEADLALTKTVRPTGGAEGDPVIAGQTAVYTFSVVNNGPSDAGAVTVRDALPAGVTVAGTLPVGCEVDGDTLTCVLAAGLDKGEPAWTFDITVRVDAAFTGTSLTNEAAVSSVTDDPKPGNNTDTATLDVIQRAKLTVTKEPSAETVVAGKNVTWTITVSNDGPSDAQNVSLTDPLDSGLTVVSATSITSGVSCGGTGTVTCTIGTLKAGDHVEIALVTTVRSSVPDASSIANIATATSTTLDRDTGNPATASGRGAIDVVARAALTLDKATTTPVVSAGTTATFTLAAGNDGPSDAAASVTLTDTLPDGLTYVSSSTVGGPAAWSCAAAGQTVTCELQDADGAPLALPAGAAAPMLQIVVAVASGVPAGALRNSATLTSPSDREGATDTADVQIQTYADLGIVKANVGTPTAGQDYSWTLTVTNHGPSDSVATAEDPIVVTDDLPAGVTFVSATGAGATCGNTGQSVTCALPATMTPGDAVTVTLTVAVDPAVSGTITNTATVAPSLTPEPPGAIWPNTSTVTTPTVIELADLTIAKSVLTAPADIVAGQQIAWTVTVSNLGPSNSDADADDPITVTDTLPAGVSFVAATGTGWACEPGDDTPSGRGTVTCARNDDLALGAAPDITVTGLIAPEVQGQIRNDVEVASGLTPEPPGGGSNNTAFAVARVGESADLLLGKAVSETITAGGGGQYTLRVTNLGPSAARDVRIVDTLPAGLAFSATPSEGWTCQPGADPAEVDCAYDGILSSAHSLTLLLDVTADETLQGAIVNTAVVSSTTPDPNPDNNTATATGTVAELADLSIVKTVDGSPVVGKTFEYRLAVANAGPTLARGVLMEDIVPDSLEVISVSGDGWTCAMDGTTGSVACSLPELAAGQQAPAISIVVRTLPAAYPEVSNTATVSSTTPEDPATIGDNTSTATVAVPPLSALAITKELTGDLVTGSQAHYVITVANDGPTEDPGPITVTDSMPGGLVARGATLAGAAGTCAVQAERVTCTIDRLAVGQTVTVTVTVDVLATARGEVVNTASAVSDAFGAEVQASAVGTVKVVALPSTGGSLGLALPFALALLALGLLALWWARGRPAESR